MVTISLQRMCGQCNYDLQQVRPGSSSSDYSLWLQTYNGWVETIDSSHCIVKKLPVDGYQLSNSRGAPYTFQIRRPNMRVKLPYRVLE